MFGESMLSDMYEPSIAKSFQKACTYMTIFDVYRQLRIPITTSCNPLRRIRISWVDKELRNVVTAINIRTFLSCSVERNKDCRCWLRSATTKNGKWVCLGQTPRYASCFVIWRLNVHCASRWSRLTFFWRRILHLLCQPGVLIYHIPCCMKSAKDIWHIAALLSNCPTVACKHQIKRAVRQPYLVVFQFCLIKQSTIILMCWLPLTSFMPAYCRMQCQILLSIHHCFDSIHPVLLWMKSSIDGL